MPADLGSPVKIAVAGAGYVGLANAVLLAQHNEVVVTDIDSPRVALINARTSPFEDRELERYLANAVLNLSATTEPEVAYQDADFVIVATPTNYDPVSNQFDTRSVEAVASEATRRCPDATIVIKSTVPVGFTRALRTRLNNEHILFSPEFSARRPGTPRQPAPLAHCGGSGQRGGTALCRVAAAGGREARHSHAVYRQHRGRGD